MLPIITFEATVVADPELRFTSGGKAVMDLRLVANDRKKNASGAWEDGDPLWLRAAVWERQAENVAESVKQGDRVIVVGKLREEKYEDREGVERRSMRIENAHVALSLMFNPAKAQRVERTKTKTEPEAAPPPQSDEPPF